VVLDAFSIAKKAGSARSINIVLLGVLARKLEIDKETWYNAIEERLPEKTWEINKKAFDLGYEFIK